MNNKYDVGNFSKQIDSYNNDQEVLTIKDHLKLSLDVPISENSDSK